jgi:hypothetical protein
MSDSLMTRSKIDSGPDSGPEDTAAGSRPRVFDGYVLHNLYVILTGEHDLITIF